MAAIECKYTQLILNKLDIFRFLLILSCILFAFAKKRPFLKLSFCTDRVSIQYIDPAL